MYNVKWPRHVVNTLEDLVHYDTSLGNERQSLRWTLMKPESKYAFENLILNTNVCVIYEMVKGAWPTIIPVHLHKKLLVKPLERLLKSLWVRLRENKKMAKKIATWYDAIAGFDITHMHKYSSLECISQWDHCYGYRIMASTTYSEVHLYALSLYRVYAVAPMLPKPDFGITREVFQSIFGAVLRQVTFKKQPPFNIRQYDTALTMITQFQRELLSRVEENLGIKVACVEKRTQTFSDSLRELLDSPLPQCDDDLAHAVHKMVYCEPSILLQGSGVNVRSLRSVREWVDTQLRHLSTFLKRTPLMKLPIARTLNREESLLILNGI